MINLKITADDLVIENGNLALVDGSEAIAQRIRQHLQTWKTEHFIDVTRGVDWLRFFAVSTGYEQKKQILRREIMSVKGVLALNNLDMEYDVANRKLTVTFKATSEYGSIEDEVEV